VETRPPTRALATAALPLRPPATDVHHKIPLVDGGSFLDQANLEPLCRRCHAIETGKLHERRQRKAGSRGRPGRDPVGSGRARSATTRSASVRATPHPGRIF
jgi:5-methylcytosine-specific restriction endonuclease McrA